MTTLKDEFIKYLSENLKTKIDVDIQKNFDSIQETGILLKCEIMDLSALDSDDKEFVFKLKINSEILTVTGETRVCNLYLEYSCELDNGIKNLTFVELKKEGCNTQFSYISSLTDYFIPFNSRDKYDKLAIRFLKYYLGYDYLEYPLAVYKLIEKTGVKCYISTNKEESLGKTVFKDCSIKLSEKASPIPVKKGSIIINTKNLILTHNDKLLRTTIVHECLHWHYHRKAFEIIMLLNGQYHYFDCIDYKKKTGDPIINAMSWMEIQAYSLTKACLMLEDNVKKFVDPLISLHGNDFSEGSEKIDLFYSIASKVSDTFGSTLTDAIKRLTSLGYKEFENLLNGFSNSYIDSVYQDKKLKDNETRRINDDIYNLLLEKSNNLKIAIYSHLYVYAEGFVVINDSKYVVKIIGTYFLTSYAKNNIEECALIFNVEKKYEQSFDPSNYFQFISANSGNFKSTIVVNDFEDYVIAPFMINSILQCDEKTKLHILKHSHIHDDNLTFNEYFKQLINLYNFSSVNDLIKATKCSRTVIENYRDLDDVGYSVEKVLSICAGMKITPPEAKHLIKKSGVIDLNSNSKRSKVYRSLVEDHWPYDINDWNDTLKSNNMPLLYKK